MKKTIRQFLVVALFTLGAFTNTFAQTPIAPGTIPIVSDAMLDTYAYSLVASANVQMSALSAVRQFNTNIPYLGRVADPVALAHLPDTVRPRLLLSNTGDTVDYWVSYNAGPGTKMKYGNSLFFGSDSGKPFLTKDGWVLPTFQVEPVRSDWIPWPTKKGLRNAYMDIRDESGQFVDRYYFSQDDRVDFENGILYLGSQHTRRIGEVHLDYEDDSGNAYTEVFNLRNGRQIRPEEVVSEDMDVNFRGLNRLPNNATAVHHKAIDGQAKLYYVAYTVNRNVLIDFEAPAGLEVKIFAKSAETIVSDPGNWGDPVPPGRYNIPAGSRIFFRFEWGPPNTESFWHGSSGGGSGGSSSTLVTPIVIEE